MALFCLSLHTHYYQTRDTPITEAGVAICEPQDSTKSPRQYVTWDQEHPRMTLTVPDQAWYDSPFG